MRFEIYRKKFQKLQDKDLILTLENTIRGGISSVLGDRYVKSHEKLFIIYFDANYPYGHSFSQPVPYDEIKFDKNVKLEDLKRTPDNSDIGYFTEVDSIYPHKKKKNQKLFQMLLKIKKINTEIFTI